MSVVNPEQLIAADQGHVLHGFAPLGNTVPGPVIARASGNTHLIDVEGNLWLDAAGGQANMALGYGRSDLADVVADALRQIAYGTHFYHGRSHVYAAQLAERLAGITPNGIDQFFFTVGGSDAVETAIKFARFSNIVSGRPERTHIIGRWSSYHGTSYGAASLTGDPKMWANIGVRLDGFSHIEQPRGDNPMAGTALEDEILRVGPGKVAAFIAEPISTPFGIVPPPSDYWPHIREICDRYEVLLIADEVLTGFGRTGEWFAVDHWNVQPDILLMSKAVTAGYFPLAAVGVTAEVRRQLAVGNRNFVHGFTGGGHPAACAAALATIDIIERENVLAQSATGGAYLLEQVQRLAARHPSLNAASARGLGMMVAVDIDSPNTSPGYGTRLHDQFEVERVFLRRYRDDETIGFLPALTISSQEIDEIIGRLDRAFNAVPG